MPELIPVATSAELPSGQRKLVFAGGRSFLLVRIDGALRAYENACPHQGAAIAHGKVDGAMLTCPAHGLRFDLRSGCTRSEYPLCLARYPLEERDGQLLLGLERLPA